eukprot:252960-Rhodomonas_salina.1
MDRLVLRQATTLRLCYGTHVWYCGGVVSYAMSGTDLAYGPMSGTDLAYGATRTPAYGRAATGMRPLSARYRPARYAYLPTRCIVVLTWRLGGRAWRIVGLTWRIGTCMA